jgi:hypothetical protein
MASWQEGNVPGPDSLRPSDFAPIAVLAVIALALLAAREVGWVGGVAAVALGVLGWLLFAAAYAANELRLERQLREDRQREEQLRRLLWPGDEPLFTQGELRRLEELGIRQAAPRVFVRGGDAR